MNKLMSFVLIISLLLLLVSCSTKSSTDINETSTGDYLQPIHLMAIPADTSAFMIFGITQKRRFWILQLKTSRTLRSLKVNTAYLLQFTQSILKT